MTSLQGSASAPLTDAPGPAPMPLLGAAGTVIRYATDPIGFAGRIFREYGDVAMLVRAPIRVMSPNGHGVVLVNGAKHNREILTQHDRYHMYALPGRFYPEGEASPREVPVRRTMTGLFHVNDDEHRRHRRLLMPAFQKTRIDGYRDDMAALSTELVDRWRDGEVRDVHADMTELTLRIATKTLFGEDAGEDGLRLAQRMQAWLVTMFGIGMMIARDWPLLPYRRWLDLTAALDRETVAILRRKRDKGATGTDMLSALIAARDDDGTGLTEDELVGHTGVVFAAGHETSTNALAWTLLLLSQHPDVARDLADELTGALHGEAPTVDDLAKLPLLDGVVKESMRVLPPVPLHPRLVAKDSELGGYKLPKNTEIFLSIYHMHMDPDVFADPRAFLAAALGAHQAEHVRVQPVQRRSAHVHRRRVRHDGDQDRARHDPAALLGRDARGLARQPAGGDHDGAGGGPADARRPRAGRCAACGASARTDSGSRASAELTAAAAGAERGPSFFAAELW